MHLEVRAMRGLVGVLAVLCCAMVGLQAAAAQEKRVALVIGNAAYSAVPELPTSRKDARDIAAALRAAGFGEVIEHYDLGRREMLGALTAFADKAAGADWAVVYYAGHGIEAKGRNYLVPIDAQLKTATEAELEALRLDRVLEPVAHARRLGLVILDACRANPFPMALGSHYIPRGLAPVEPSDPRLRVAFAARHGEAAVDGPAGGNGPYAKALAQALAEPGLEVHMIFRKVQADVLAATGGRQRPHVYGLFPPEPLYLRPPPPWRP
jgi:uncharacterized caspase-like protein